MEQVEEQNPMGN